MTLPLIFFIAYLENWVGRPKSDRLNAKQSDSGDGTKYIRHPVSDVVPRIEHVVSRAMLNAALTLSEKL
ncbi:hypothetical protein D3C84_1083610 [compost metagenome]